MASLIHGCEPETRYKTLSFFFDGVPEPKNPAQGEKSNTNIKNTNQNSGDSIQKAYKEHGPYAAKLCEGCHMRGSNRLIVPIEELCIRCHAVMQTTKRKVHGPLAAGGCKICHEPHGSRYPYFLVADSKTFCLYCHKKSDIMKREVHQGKEMHCTSCHDAHSSDNDYLLK